MGSPETCPTCGSDEREVRCCADVRDREADRHVPWGSDCLPCENEWHAAPTPPAHDEAKRKAGLYGKFRVERADGKSAPGQKHDGCDYFVLDLTHDPIAPDALRAYAAGARRAGYGPLADDLDAKVGPAPRDDQRARDAVVEAEIATLRNALACAAVPLEVLAATECDDAGTALAPTTKAAVLRGRDAIRAALRGTNRPEAGDKGGE